MALMTDPFALLYERIRSVITSDVDLLTVIDARNVIASNGAAERETGNIVAISTSEGKWDYKTRKAQATIQIEVSCRYGPLTASQILTHISTICKPISLSNNQISVKLFKEQEGRSDTSIGYQQKPAASSQFLVFWILPR